MLASLDPRSIPLSVSETGFMVAPSCRLKRNVDDLPAVHFSNASMSDQDEMQVESRMRVVKEGNVPGEMSDGEGIVENGLSDKSIEASLPFVRHPTTPIIMSH